jgi:hypothetical protein
MKRQCQIEQQRVVQQFRRIATEQNPKGERHPATRGTSCAPLEANRTAIACWTVRRCRSARCRTSPRHRLHQCQPGLLSKLPTPCCSSRRSRPAEESTGCCKTRLRTTSSDGAKRDQRLGSYGLFQRSVPLQAGVGQEAARAVEAQLRRGRKGFSQRLWCREVGGEKRTLSRLAERRSSS